MWFLGIGLILTALKYLEIGPVANWSWWLVLAPYALAVAWWAFADATGYTKRKAMERENARVRERIERQRQATGQLPRKRK